jgi:hypothetical protein
MAIKTKTVQEAYTSLLCGDGHLQFVEDQLNESDLAMRTVHSLAGGIVQGGAIHQSALLSAIASAMSIGVKIGLEMSGACSPIVGPGGAVIQ